MANKRMFSKAIIDSDMFLDMPKSAQALYFHLGMRADDDGFLDNAKRSCAALEPVRMIIKFLWQKIT